MKAVEKNNVRSVKSNDIKKTVVLQKKDDIEKQNQKINRSDNGLSIFRIKTRK
jgi:hypothetical protein